LSVTDTLNERGARYGKFADHAKIAQALQDVIRDAPNWDNLDYDMKQALVVFTDKIARILNGDPFYLDNWHDIQGYAKLIEDRLQMIVDKPQDLYEPPAEIKIHVTNGQNSLVDKETMRRVFNDALRGDY
jgi:hypothetical protein